jgi:hypothetical protein
MQNPVLILFCNFDSVFLFSRGIKFLVLLYNNLMYVCIVLLKLKYIRLSMTRVRRIMETSQHP